MVGDVPKDVREKLQDLTNKHADGVIDLAHEAADGIEVAWRNYRRYPCRGIEEHIRMSTLQSGHTRPPDLGYCRECQEIEMERNRAQLGLSSIKREDVLQDVPPRERMEVDDCADSCSQIMFMS